MPRANRYFVPGYAWHNGQRQPEIRIRGREKPFRVGFAGSSGFLFTLHSSLFTLHSSLFTLHSSLFTLHSSRDRKIPDFVKAGEVAELAAIRLGTAA